MENFLECHEYSRNEVKKVPFICLCELECTKLGKFTIMLIEIFVHSKSIVGELSMTSSGK